MLELVTAIPGNNSTPKPHELQPRPASHQTEVAETHPIVRSCTLRDVSARMLASRSRFFSLSSCSRSRKAASLAASSPRTEHNRTYCVRSRLSDATAAQTCSVHVRVRHEGWRTFRGTTPACGSTYRDGYIDTEEGARRQFHAIVHRHRQVPNQERKHAEKAAVHKYEHPARLQRIHVEMGQQDGNNNLSHVITRTHTIHTHTHTSTPPHLW